MDEAIEKGSSRHHYRARVDHAPIAQADAGDSARIFCSLIPGPRSLHFKIHHFGLLDEEVLLSLQHLAHLDAVEGLVALRARRPDGRPARCVEQAELDAAGVGDLAHDATQRVHLADEVSLGDASDGGVAAHLGDQVEVEGEERGAQAHARGGHRCLAAGVARANHNDIELFGKRHQPHFMCAIASS